VYCSGLGVGEWRGELSESKSSRGKGRKEGWPRDLLRCLQARARGADFDCFGIGVGMRQAFQLVKLASAVEPSCPALVEAQTQTTSQLL
jgi:hypothetical protein